MCEPTQQLDAIAMDSVRRALAGTGIAVTLIEPDYIATPLTAERAGRMPGPELIADAVVDVLVRPRRRVILPRRYRAVALLAAVFPGRHRPAIRVHRRGAPPRPLRIAKLAQSIRHARRPRSS